MDRIRLIVRFGGGEYVNVPVTRIEREENVVFAYLGDTFVGFFDLGGVEAL